MWTEERVATLRRLWAEGFSAAEIAKDLGWVTRSAIIGKAHRLGLSGRFNAGSEARRTGVKRERARPANAQRTWRRPKFKVQPPPPPESVASLHIPFLDVRANQCRAVTDTTKWEQRCCGHEVALGSVYCPSHHARFYCAVVAKPEALAA